MLRQISFLVVMGCGALLAAGQQGFRPELHARREAESDLEVTGLLKGLPAGRSRFVSRAYIQGLPHVAVTMKHNADFPDAPPQGIPVRGIYLDVLAKALGVSRHGLAIEAICNDGYAATYPPEYMRHHRPIFVTTMEDLSLHDWAVKHNAYDAAPYLIGFEDFKPAFHILSHEDRPAEPSGILKLGFFPETRMYEGIIPAKSTTSPEIDDGYRIAEQNCFRCHNAAGHGGTKAGKNWSTLGQIAHSKPEWFASWVHNPQSIDPKAKMPPNLEYDKPTLQALTKYFATFATEIE